jgi:hypothetical protein
MVKNFEVAEVALKRTDGRWLSGGKMVQVELW